jgi:uncharacterized membrane protein YhaH (DUF805 family)
MENPYQAPKSDVADVNRDEEYQPVRIFSVSGRIGRVRFIAYAFGLSFLVTTATVILALVAGTALGPVLVLANWVAIIVISLMLSVQRAHDFNASGWLAILGLIPLVNLIFWFIPGTDGTNRFGHKTPPNSWGTVAVACIIPLIFVIGILAAVAIPAYQDYANRPAIQNVR